MNKFLKNLQLTAWYKAGVLVSVAAFLVALMQQRYQLSIILGGAFLIALGELRNHPKKQVEVSTDTGGNVWKITSFPRSANWLGILVQLAGAGLIFVGIYRAFA